MCKYVHRLRTFNMAREREKRTNYKAYLGQIALKATKKNSSDFQRRTKQQSIEDV